MDISYLIPGTTDPAITIRRTMLGNIAVLVNGQPAKRRRFKGLTYEIPMADGTTTDLRLAGQWTGLKATANGVETVLEPRVSRWYVLLTVVPLLLVFIGGLIGAVIGVAASSANLAISRSGVGAPVKVVAMLGASVLALAVYLGVAFVISPTLTLATGQCLNGVRDGVELTAKSGRSVDCGPAHDNEVVGTVRYSGTGSYPGQAALASFAEQPCVDAFAGYVGISYVASTLEMILITPSDLTWVKGDRDIACVAVAPTGQRLTGTIRGTAR